MPELIAREEVFDDGFHFQSVYMQYTNTAGATKDSLHPFRLRPYPEKAYHETSGWGGYSNSFFGSRFSSMAYHQNSNSANPKNGWGYTNWGVAAGVYTNQVDYKQWICNRIHLRFMGGKHPGSNLYGMHSESVTEVHLQVAGGKSRYNFIPTNGTYRLPLQVSLVSASHGSRPNDTYDWEEGKWPLNMNAYSERRITAWDFGSCWGKQSWNGTYVENSDGYQDQYDYTSDSSYRGRTLYADDSIEWVNDNQIKANKPPGSEVDDYQNKFILNQKGIDALMNSRWFTVQIIDTVADLNGGIVDDDEVIWSAGQYQGTSFANYAPLGLYTQAYETIHTSSTVVDLGIHYPYDEHTYMWWGTSKSGKANELALSPDNTKEENGVISSGGPRSAYITVYGNAGPAGTMKIDNGTIKMEDGFNGVFNWEDKEKVYRNLDEDDLIEGFK